MSNYMGKWIMGLTLALSFVLSSCGPSNYEECVVHYSKPGMSDYMIGDVHRMCRKKFPYKSSSRTKEALQDSLRVRERAGFPPKCSEWRHAGLAPPDDCTF